MTLEELRKELRKAHKALDIACNRYSRNSTEENFQKALNAETRVNKIEDEIAGE